MSENNNTVTEVNDDNNKIEKILFNYELAFHILPTVAEGELTQTFQTLQELITKAGGEITVMEEPERFELSYDIVKQIEGRNRKFSSAYFGWIRFISDAKGIDVVTEEIKDVKKILRYLLIKLTKDEVENPFYFHQILSEEKKIENVDELESGVDKEVEVQEEAEEEIENDSDNDVIDGENPINDDSSEDGEEAVASAKDSKDV